MERTVLNSRVQKYNNINEECLDGPISKCDTAEFSEHKERSIKMSQTEMQGEKMYENRI